MFGIGQTEATIIGLVGLLIYIVPTIIAHNRRHERFAAIAALNLLLGWTLIVWIVCFIWANTGHTVAAAGTTKACPYCKAVIPAQAAKCQHCAEWIEKPAAVDPPAPAQ